MIQQKHLQIFFPLIRHTRTHALSLSLSLSPPFHTYLHENETTIDV